MSKIVKTFTALALGAALFGAASLMHPGDAQAYGISCGWAGCVPVVVCGPFGCG